MTKRKRNSGSGNSESFCGNQRSNALATILLVVVIGSSMTTEIDAFSTYVPCTLKRSVSIKQDRLLTSRIFQRQGPLGAIALEQSSEDTTSSASSSSSILAIGNSKDWIRWEQDLVQLGRQGRTDEALQLFDSLMESLVAPLSPQERQLQLQLPPLSTRVRWWNAALDACARARPARCDDALELFQRGLQLTLPSPYADGGDDDEPLHLLQPNVFTFGILTSACARARRPDLALDLLRHMETDYGVAPNAVVYSTVISACARASPEPMVSTAIDLLREATNERRLPMNVVGYNSVLAACAKAGDWQQAIEILDSMEQQEQHDQQQQQSASLSANNKNGTVSSSSSSSSSSIHSKSLLPRPPPPDMVTYGTVMAACERAEQWELVLTCTKRASQHYPNGMDVLALTSALHACQQLGLAEEALRYLQLMKKQQHQQQNYGDHKKTYGWQRQGVKQPLRGPDAVAYRLAISACARGGAWKEGLALLDELRSLDSSNSSADVVAYTAAVNGCEYAGEWQQALMLLEKMRKDGVEPNEVTMASVFGACATACAKIVAASSSQQSLTSTNNDNNSSNIISNNLNQVVHPQVSFRDESYQQPIMLPPQRKALQLLQLMKKDETTFVRPNIVVYNAAIRVCAEACDLPRAFVLGEDLRREGLQATVVTYGSLMTACERVGNLEGASKVFKSMKEDGLEPNEIIYGAAISCCRKAHEPERAMLLLRKMIREGLSPNVATFHTVLVAQTEGSRTKEGHLNYNNNKGDMERAILVYKLMKSSKYSSTDTRPNRQTYHLLIRALASRRYPREAEYMLHKMQRDGMIPDVDLYTATVTAYERSGQPLQALRLMESMREDGYDFYEVKVLNEAFKKAINLVNVVGKGLSPRNNENDNNAGYRFGLDDEEGFEESFFNGR